MDNEESKENEDTNYSEKAIPVLSSYYKNLEPVVKGRYLQKISVIGVDPATISSEHCDPECIPAIESMDLVSYLVLTTSHYTKEQFKAFKSLEAYNQMISGFVTGVIGCIISDKYVVIAKVRHSQRMNDPLVSIWIITSKEGIILSSHCLGCKAGLSETCSHVASVLFYIEAFTRINGKLACTQVKCTWILPTYVKEVPYARVADIKFTSARKMKQDLDTNISNLVSTSRPKAPVQANKSSIIPTPSTADMALFYSELNKCTVKPVALALVKPYAEQFVSKSASIKTVSELFDKKYLEYSYPDLLLACKEVKIELSNEEIDQIERDTLSQSKCKSFFKHRAGRIGSSQSGAVCHTNSVSPSQSLIKSICYPELFKISTEAVNHGCTHEKDAILFYEREIKKHHKDFKVKQCGLFINKENQFIHATPDILCSCSCCGDGCGEVKCPISVKQCDFEAYVRSNGACLEKVDGVFKLKRTHNYYYQVQQQMFTLGREYCDFVVYAVDDKKNSVIVHERIYKDSKHWFECLPKLKKFWFTCILPEILGRWYTKRNVAIVPSETPDPKKICFCRMDKKDENTIICANTDCPYVKFHHSCLAISTQSCIPATWICPYCQKLPQFKRGKSSTSTSTLTPSEALAQPNICVCKSKAKNGDKLLECHSSNCSYGKFFHLACLNYKRLPNNSKTTWICPECRRHELPSTAIPGPSKKHASTAIPGPSKKHASTAIPGPSKIHASTAIPVPMKVHASTAIPGPSKLHASTAIPGPSKENASTAIPGPSKENTPKPTMAPELDSFSIITGISKTCSSKSNSQKLLGELTGDDLNLILSPHGWLNCSIIQQAHVLFQQTNPLIEGFQRPTLGPVRNFDIVKGEFIQVLHTGNYHWVCVSNIGCSLGMVNLYDSLFNDVIESEVENQVQSLLFDKYKGLSPVPVQQQNNGSDCGVFAIAFATCLVHGIMPEDVDFNIPQMRPHLYSCFKNQEMIVFPTL